MEKKRRYKILYSISEEDVFNTAEEMEIPREKITREIMKTAEKALEDGFSDSWHSFIEDTLREELHIDDEDDDEDEEEEKNEGE